jgi:threonine/homoserine/homoserine lactone efflux protein
MGSAIWNGFIMGLGLSFSFGPVFFMLIQTSIDKGWKESLIFDAGVLLSDFIIIAAAMLIIFTLGVDVDFSNPRIQFWSALIGAIILIVFGLILLFNPRKKNSSSEIHDIKEVVKLNHSGLFFKGLGINFLNPSVFLIWFGAVPAVAGSFGGNMRLILTFFSSTMISYFIIDLGKIYTARKLKRFLTPTAITNFHRISGVLFIIIAIWLLYRHFSNS